MLIRACFVALLVAAAVGAVTIGQIDTFQGGTTLGWGVPGPSPNPPVVVSTGGPAGLGDAYLELTAVGGGGAGSRLAVLNTAQWAGDYTASGVTRIRMKVRNFGPEDLYLRLFFEDFELPGPPVNTGLSANAILVAAGGDWTTIIFPITASDLVTAGLGTPAGALADTNTFRIFHNPDPTFPGPGAGIPTVNALLGVDDIEALEAIPEPATILLIASGLGILALLRRKLH